jgi:hypothetical protein
MRKVRDPDVVNLTHLKLIELRIRGLAVVQNCESPEISIRLH